jgi:hypothetical protein
LPFAFPLAGDWGGTEGSEVTLMLPNSGEAFGASHQTKNRLGVARP